jgi:hypothetical protein
MYARILFMLLFFSATLGAAQTGPAPEMTLQQSIRPVRPTHNLLPDTTNDARVLVIAPEIRRNLDILAGGLKVEFVLCLHGEVSGDTAYVSSISVPAIERADSISVKTGECQTPVLATWHNHPFVGADALDVLPEDYCVMSIGDVAMAAFGPANFSIISVDKNHMCWWSRRQAQGLTYGEYLQGYMEAVPGQHDFRGLVDARPEGADRDGQ